MKKYEHYEEADFLLDDAFITWVQHPNAENARFWEQWLAENPAKKTVVEQAAAIIHAMQFHEVKMDDAAFYDRLKNRIDATIAAEAEVPQQKGRTFTFFTPLRMAASVAFLIGCAVWAWYLLRPAAMDNMTTGYAALRTTTFPDGTEVTLNAASTIRYPATWDNAHREVWLEGEAFFKVAHTNGPDGKASRFVVHAGKSAVEVLGTQFNVAARHEQTAVALKQGSIRFTADGNGAIILKPGDLVKYDEQTQGISKLHPEVYTAGSWTAKQYIFDETPLTEVCVRLQDYFGKEILVDDTELRSRKITGTLDVSSEPLAVQALGTLLQAKVDRTGNRLVIHK